MAVYRKFSSGNNWKMCELNKELCSIFLGTKFSKFMEFASSKLNYFSNWTPQDEFRAACVIFLAYYACLKGRDALLSKLLRNLEKSKNIRLLLVLVMWSDYKLNSLNRKYSDTSIEIYSRRNSLFPHADKHGDLAIFSEFVKCAHSFSIPRIHLSEQMHCTGALSHVGVNKCFEGELDQIYTLPQHLFGSGIHNPQMQEKSLAISLCKNVPCSKIGITCHISNSCSCSYVGSHDSEGSKSDAISGLHDVEKMNSINKVLSEHVFKENSLPKHEKCSQSVLLLGNSQKNNSNSEFIRHCVDSDYRRQGLSFEPKDWTNEKSCIMSQSNKIEEYVEKLYINNCVISSTDSDQSWSDDSNDENILQADIKFDAIITRSISFQNWSEKDSSSDESIVFFESPADSSSDYASFVAQISSSKVSEMYTSDSDGDDSSILFMEHDEGSVFDKFFDERCNLSLDADDWEDSEESDSEVTSGFFTLSDPCFVNPCFVDDILTMSSGLAAANENWKEIMEGVDDKPREAKRVSFVPSPNLVTVHLIESEDTGLSYDVDMLDRIRFQMRINQLETLLSPFLTPAYRMKVLQRNNNLSYS